MLSILTADAHLPAKRGQNVGMNLLIFVLSEIANNEKFFSSLIIAFMTQINRTDVVFLNYFLTFSALGTKCEKTS